MKKVFVVAALAATFGGGCRCGPTVNKVLPQLNVQPANLNFGFVKVATSQDLPLNLSALSQASVAITGMTLADGSQGGAAAFAVISPPTSIPGQGQVAVSIRCTPPATQSYAAILTIASNDPKAPSTQVSLTCQGANPQLALIPGCPQNCQGAVTATPPAIDFGSQVMNPANPTPVAQLPTVQFSNTGNVQLTLTRIDIEGPDSSAFSFVQPPRLTNSLPDGGPALFLAPGTGQTASLRFNPTSQTQASYQANLVVISDDPVNSPANVALTGQLLPDSPVVCANITQVAEADGTGTLNYNTPAIWATLIPAPDAGYDFSTSRDIQPASTVSFSALSDPNDTSKCTTDPQFGRTGLKYQWAIVSQPVGSNAIIGSPTSPTPTMLPTVPGFYTVSLGVTNSQGASTRTSLTFEVVLRKDLVVQLSWNQPDGGYPGVDLDLHLVRPSSADAGDPFSGTFSYFSEPAPSGTTSGDMNGKSKLTASQNQGLGFNFDWGVPGIFDNPSLDVDDIGQGALVENISLNYPEDDPACATQSCSYKVMVHYFQDRRASGSPPQCTVGGSCFDGDQCNCVDPSTRCVANTADAGQAATGAGLCYVAPQPVVRVYVKANPIPAAVIPLDPIANPQLIGSPCQMWYVAQVVWPSKAWIADAGLGFDGGFPAQVIVQGPPPVFARFGERPPGGLQCAPDIVEGGSQTPNWYGLEPR